MSATESSMSFDALSKREREVFELFLQGYSHKEIAARLGISPKTENAHKASLQRKLGAKSNVELVKIGIRAGLVEL